MLLCGGVCHAELLEEEVMPTIKQAVKSVKSLMEHRRQDVREAEEEKQLAEEEERQKKERAQEVTLEEQFKLVENLLKIRIQEMVKAPRGTSVKAALDVVRRHAARHKTPVKIVWAEGENAEENNRLKLKTEVNLYGCMASEAIARICDAANCGFMVRGRQVELTYYGKDLREEKIPCPHAVFEECFFNQRVAYDAKGKKLDARLLSSQKNAGVRYRYEIKAPRIVNLLDFKLQGEYNPESGILGLKGTRMSLIQCRKEVDDVYHIWLRSARVKIHGVQDTNTHRYRVNRKLNAHPVVPIEFAERCSLKEIVRYLNLVAGKSRIKLVAAFAVGREHEDSMLREDLVIPHSTFLEAVFCVCDAIRGTYTVQGNKVTFLPRELDSVRYETRNEWPKLVANWKSGKEDESRSAGRRFLDKMDGTDDDLKKVLKSVGIQIPDDGSAEESQETLPAREGQSKQTRNVLTVKAGPRAHFHLERLFKYIKIIENP